MNNKVKFLQQNAPCYLYEEDSIKEHCHDLLNAMPGMDFLYSAKTNPFMPVLKTVAEQGFGADTASANEVLIAQKAGIPYDKIYYSAPGKTLQDLEKVWGKCTIIADSLSELARLEQCAAVKNERIAVGVRVNPNFSMNGESAVSSKFGIDEDQLKTANLCFPHLKIIGIHVHLRSQILDADILCGYYRNCYMLAERINELNGVEIQFINFGSGIGTVYDRETEKPLALERVGQTLQTLRAKNHNGLQAKFILETGRFVVCNAGTYYTRIVDRKISCGKTYLVVQNAMNGFLRPAIAELLRQNVGEFPKNGQEPLYTTGSQSAFRIVGRNENCETVDIVGNLCTALDVMAKNITLPHAEIGDILAVSNAGSYGCTLTPLLFSNQETPKEFLWTKENE
ncbi:diaminopimelate decarboxylase family protein [Lactonifactor longoviformis]|uniref:Diaminopimelate decarboxylase n=1 Tax=Lactonifactor longoviformis DSM 17459 TaxID=1122155 RepID=A0A1M4T378_9CLOT|nr:diaminopimelate decarboxylase [Lactonifactor longoviformis]SHE38992.1 diaminopimelate decarboxylase [Lactonifactor longoviformis DSM 17459]